jgi:recombination associated protein RdgC
LTETLQLKKVQYLDGVMDESGTDKTEDRFDADVALSTGLLGPLIDSLIEALGGEMELGAAAADQALPNPTRTVLNSTLTTGATGAAATDEDPPF